MMQLYSATAALSCIALILLGLLIHENSRLAPKEKRSFYRTYIVVIVSIAAEWSGLALNGAPEWTAWLHSAVKCLDYVFTPIAGVCFIYQLTPKGRLQRYLWLILGLNAVLSFLSIFTGWFFFLDEANVYHHGPLYPLYMAVYSFAIVAVIIGFIRYGKQYRRQNRGSLYAIIALLGVGIVIQELTGLRTYFLCVIFAATLLFIHFSEFSQLKSDDTLSTQRKLLETDALTGLYSRYAYTEELHSYDQMDGLPDDLMIFSIDVNGLKTTNDNHGHLAGDELIQAAADCIRTVLSPCGKCFRTGGDEFIAILRADSIRAGSLHIALKAAAGCWHGKLAPGLSFSIGHCLAADHPGIRIEKLIQIADDAMYDEKREYYKQSGHERRRNS